MNKNPYDVLGVSENATDEEIKQAYRTLVKKYHPDKYAKSDLAELANEKMSEINTAYDEIQKLRSSGGNKGYGGDYSGNTYSSGSYSSGTSYSANSEYASIRVLINSRQFAQALMRLNGIASTERGAEWNFLYGLSLYGTGRVFDAISYIEKACSMDPSNMEYRAARDRISQMSFSGGMNGNSGQSQCTGCDVCSTLICADCCCECCGGDLIRCC